MGGGDLNLKKSWHPLLQKNREEVWKREKAALDERKRIAQLRKEHAEERAIQDLQRLGGHREERVEWLYAAPATGGEKSAEELEAYLLGKKTVTDLFKEQDAQRLATLKAKTGSSGTSQTISNFQALGSTATNVRDIASKVRDDPLLAIRQQELASLEAMKKNRTVMREAQGAIDEREQRRQEKQARHEEREERRRRKADRRSRRDDSRSPPVGSGRGRSRSPRRRDDSPPRRRDNSSPPRRREDSPPARSRQRSPPRFDAPRRAPISRASEAPKPSAAERLAAMTAAAAEHQARRAERMTEASRAEQEEIEREETLRAQQAAAARGQGFGADGPSFLRQERERYSSKALSEHLRAGGRSYQRDQD